MSPPKYDDLGKKIDDLFKGFDAGKTVLTLKSKTSNGIALKVKGTRSNSKGSVDGEIETSGVHGASGLAWKEKWTTKNEVTTELAKADLLTKGTKFTGEATLSPTSGLKGTCFKGDFKSDAVFVSTKFSNLKSLTASVSFNPVKNFFTALKCDFKDGFELKGYEAKAAYIDTDFQVTSTILSSQKVKGSIYHTPQPNLEAGVEFDYTRAEGSATGFKVGGAYKMDSDTEVKAYVNKDFGVGLAYNQTLRKGIKVGWFADINAAKLGEDAHKLGMSLELSH